MAVANAQVSIAKGEPEQEQQLLLQNDSDESSVRCRGCGNFRFRYRLITIPQRSGILIIILNTFIFVALCACSWCNTTNEPVDYKVLLTTPSGCVILLYPIIGLLSECYFGKYKILLISVYFLLITILLTAFNIIICPINIWYVIFIPMFFSAASYTTCIIPLTMDQLVGASGEELSFTVYWLAWPIALS